MRAADPEPKAELEFRQPVHAARGRGAVGPGDRRGVNLATGPLFAVADTPEKMLALGEERVRGFIRTIGLFNTKAKNVIALSRILVERHGGAVPASQAELQVLPGVGAKTASVVLNIAFGDAAHRRRHPYLPGGSNRIPLFVGADHRQGPGRAGGDRAGALPAATPITG